MITVTKIIISVPNWSIKDNASYTVTLSPPYGVTNLSGVSANIITKRSGYNKMFVVSFFIFPLARPAPHRSPPAQPQPNPLPCSLPQDNGCVRLRSAQTALPQAAARQKSAHRAQRH